jgi:hypothetical protein
MTMDWVPSAPGTSYQHCEALAGVLQIERVYLVVAKWGAGSDTSTEYWIRKRLRSALV